MLAKFDDTDSELEGAIGNGLHFKEKGKIYFYVNDQYRKNLNLSTSYFFLSTFSFFLEQTGNETLEY